MLNKVIAWLCLVPGIAIAQTDSLQKKIKYYNSFVSGIMTGSSEDADAKEFSVSFTTVHGVKFSPGIKAGIGVGIDTYYDLKVFPILLSVTIDEEKRKHGFFVQVNGGYSFARYTEREQDFEEIDVHAQGGFMINPMIGYRMIIENKRIYVLAGYKYQVASLNYDYPEWWGFAESSKEYELNRFVIQLGFGLE
ncbi:MAG TPA: hypothetical protein VFU05_14415 [Cyclobacteriaceae bacterium]|nr:hypothetical protein [Cyclobacteriaceae bacterium]